ncbi:hypothetical protein KHP62_18365 [Rhodobacteraceae bacterium NNCM2]|nr:hypothetical protein [Coraliihabitans acroporae]
MTTQVNKIPLYAERPAKVRGIWTFILVPVAIAALALVILSGNPAADRTVGMAQSGSADKAQPRVIEDWRGNSASFKVVE